LAYTDNRHIVIPPRSSLPRSPFVRLAAVPRRLSATAFGSAWTSIATARELKRNITDNGWHCLLDPSSKMDWSCPVITLADRFSRVPTPHDLATSTTRHLATVDLRATQVNLRIDPSLRNQHLHVRSTEQKLIHEPQRLCHPERTKTSKRTELNPTASDQDILHFALSATLLSACAVSYASHLPIALAVLSHWSNHCSGGLCSGGPFLTPFAYRCTKQLSSPTVTTTNHGQRSLQQVLFAAWAQRSWCFFTLVGYYHTWQLAASCCPFEDTEQGCWWITAWAGASHG
jgi:hypothetical protein